MVRVAEASLTIRELEKVFVENPKLGHEQLRLLKSEQHAEFLRQAIELLEEGSSNSFSQVLRQFCREDSANLKQMMFAADLLTLDEAARLLRISSKGDPAYQVHLMASVKSEIEKAGAGYFGKDYTRMLDILSKAVDPERMGSMLASLVNHPDERLRSKVALMARGLGRALPKRSELMRDPDPRVRANTVESFWGQRDPDTIQFFKDAVADEHHRVAANALYGLYQAGEIAAVRGILKMVRDPDLGRQLSGIWLIGQTSDPRFTSVVHENLPVKSGRVKFALLNAGRRIKKRLDDIGQMERLEFDLIHFERVEKGRVRTTFLLKHPDGSYVAPQEVVATQVLLHDGELRIDQFLYECRGGTESLHAAFLVPLRTGLTHPFANKLTSSLEAAVTQKRGIDEWCFYKYKWMADGQHVAPSRLLFSNNSEALCSEQLRGATAHADNLLAAVEQAAMGFPAQATRKHVVLVIDPDAASAWIVPDHLPELLERFGVVFHVICCRDLEPESIAAWRKVAIARRGIFMSVPDPAQLQDAAVRLSRALPTNCYVSYQLGRSLPNPDPLERVSIEVLSKYGSGKITVQGTGEILPERLAGASEELSEAAPSAG